ncbi:NUDIX domain-containing protein [Glycomyces paridis]|uniref:NUDIX hydrolase n=1 Tax=Glycomyces paridis TaxID=2126555 RepID=A0A4V4HN18_9ACTN|nr:NUDIX hydrolase [Glycomyces paridis]THV24256.1 NUDIX hydrolase [Glycomyces paridis]
MNDPRYPPQEILDGFSISYAVACAFFTDPQGRVLIVKPNYRDSWLFVGGMVDRGESPFEACAREVKEEIGIDVEVGDLLVLHWVQHHSFVPEPMTIYVFDCGVIEDPTAIRLQAAELDEFAFLPVEEAAARFSDRDSARIGLALGARRSGRTVYQRD